MKFKIENCSNDTVRVDEFIVTLDICNKFTNFCVLLIHS